MRNDEGRRGTFFDSKVVLILLSVSTVSCGMDVPVNSPKFCGQNFCIHHSGSWSVTILDSGVDFVLYNIKFPEGNLGIYEGNAPNSAQDFVEIDCSNADLLMLPKGNKQPWQFGAQISDSEFPTDIHIVFSPSNAEVLDSLADAKFDMTVGGRKPKSWVCDR